MIPPISFCPIMRSGLCRQCLEDGGSIIGFDMISARLRAPAMKASELAEGFWGLGSEETL